MGGIAAAAILFNSYFIQLGNFSFSFTVFWCAEQMRATSFCLSRAYCGISDAVTLTDNLPVNLLVH